MDIRDALKEQYHAALAMLDECVAKCPDDLWLSAAGQVDSMYGPRPRPVWRIALHAVFYTQLYMDQDEASFQGWPDGPPDYRDLWSNPAYLEPYELPEDRRPLTRSEVRDYIRFIDTLVEPVVGALDLDTDVSGFPWYPNISKLSHEVMNLRHIQGHVGQLSELLIARGIDIDWTGKSPSIDMREDIK